MKRVKEENYPDFLELASLNTCNTVYPMAIAEGAQRGEIYTDEIDEELLSRIEGRVVPLNFWSSSEEFLTKGKGYCLTKNDEVAAVAFSAAVSSRQIDIGIETKESHRRKGLAVIVAKKMAEYVLSIGKEPVWDCDAANAGSRATAERAGFEVVLQYAYYKAK